MEYNKDGNWHKMAIEGLFEEVKASMKLAAEIQAKIYEKEKRDQEIIDKFYKHCGGSDMNNFFEYLKKQPLSEKRKNQLIALQKKARSSMDIDAINDYLELATLYSEGTRGNLRQYLLNSESISEPDEANGGDCND